MVRHGLCCSRAIHSAMVATVILALAACSKSEDPSRTPRTDNTVPSKPADKAQRARLAMVEHQIVARGVTDARVIAAMKKVPRHEFVPSGVRSQAYQDTPLPIGHEQTISQPLIVASMTELAKVTSTSKVLEIGTGSGYQAAVLAEIAKDVYTIEIVEPLAKRATATLKQLGYANVHVKYGDGYRGWPEHAPFDAIVVTAAPPKIPEPLKQQLRVGGRLVIPVGDDNQYLRVVLRTKDGFKEKTVFGVRFVPMTGEAQKNR